MYTIFKHYKTFKWLYHNNSSELPITPVKGDIVWLSEDGKPSHRYIVKSREFNVIDRDSSLLIIYVKPK